MSEPTPRLESLLTDRRVLLTLGALLLAASQLRFGLGLLAWVAPVPWLLYLRGSHTFRARALLALPVLVGATLMTASIITAPLPLALAFLFSVPIALFLLAGYWLGDAVRRATGAGPLGAAAAFAAAMTLAEWAQHRFTGFASWGAAAYTQTEHLPLLQLAALTGMAGVSFLVYFVAAIVEARLAGVATRRELALPLGLVAGTYLAGEARLTLSETVAQPTVTVATVTTDSEAGTHPDLPDAQRRRADDRALFERTRMAAAAGAEVVVWNEASSVVFPDEVETWTAKVQELAKEVDADIVAAHVVALETSPLRYANKYLYVARDGTILAEYHKHRPVPGEPAVVGTEEIVALDRDFARVAGAICYDYDFPTQGRLRGATEADLVLLPSSDWRGIDPLHTEMASVRAIENGQSLLRSTRFGLSAGVDPLGRFRARASSLDGHDVMLAELPARRIQTPYALLGDWFVLLAALGLLGGLGRSAILRE